MPEKFSVSCVKDSSTGDVILKLVNGSTNAYSAQINLSRLGTIKPQATQVVLSGEPDASNSFKNPDSVAPVTEELLVGESFARTLRPDSLTVIRMKTQ